MLTKRNIAKHRIITIYGRYILKYHTTYCANRCFATSPSHSQHYKAAGYFAPSAFLKEKSEARDPAPLQGKCSSPPSLPKRYRRLWMSKAGIVFPFSGHFPEDHFLPCCAEISPARQPAPGPHKARKDDT